MCDIEQRLKQETQVACSNGIPIAELARQAGVPYSALHGFLKSNRCITLRNAAKIARVLGLELKPAVHKRKGKTRG